MSDYQRPISDVIVAITGAATALGLHGIAIEPLDFSHDPAASSQGDYVVRMYFDLDKEDGGIFRANIMMNDIRKQTEDEMIDGLMSLLHCATQYREKHQQTAH